MKKAETQKEEDGREAEEVPLGGREAVEEALLGAAALTGNLGQLCHRLRPPPPTSCQSHSSRQTHRHLTHLYNQPACLDGSGKP